MEYEITTIMQKAITAVSCSGTENVTVRRITGTLMMINGRDRYVKVYQDPRCPEYGSIFVRMDEGDIYEGRIS